MVTVSQGKVSFFPAGTEGPHLDYEIGSRVAGTSMTYDVSPELVFSPRQTLFLPNLLVRSGGDAVNIGIPQESSAAEDMIGVYDTRVDWLTLRSGKSPKTQSTSLLTSVPVSPYQAIQSYSLCRRMKTQFKVTVLTLRRWCIGLLCLLVAD